MKMRLNIKKMSKTKYQATENQKTNAEKWFSKLRDKICKEFEEIENFESNRNSFKIENWERDGGGGGKMSIMKGNIFEKVGVNISTVSGIFPDSFKKNIKGAAKDPRFFATGLSIVAHMHSPFIPAAHYNCRFIVTKEAWFGGGCDLTPTYNQQIIKKDFHNVCLLYTSPSPRD